MKVPRKDQWKATASSGDPRLAVDDRYATSWTSQPAKKPWLKIDLGKAATLAGLEVYWGKDAPVVYGFKSSLDGKRWTHLCKTRHGEGGQDVALLSRPSRRNSCAGPATTLRPSGERRSSRSTFTAPAMRRR